MDNAESTQRERNTRPFPQALGELLRVKQGDPLGMISLRAFFVEIPGYSYDALRKMVRGQLALQPEAIEAMAAVLGVSADHFIEYRSWQLQEGLKRHPEVADEAYDTLMASFALLEDQSTLGGIHKARPRRRGRPRQGTL